ncbi:hypothetical protein MGG_16003 [Pyricularia oryzae 70-15]|uniref:Uncharacterized protein n=2 Tax=Pyricularia oryzae TaxID=318829 RepID=G4MMT0_PYRO7|nr:uncharacterized protein MGG_16003 [Pyricularia oryzae 70-15]EHA56160.1 hypothetical protein MGG_16003 [Pyricularia oryzae 70-15]ELQ35956.1 hypothetical protein OOU_Y34scaffold00676g1 [Pyricularia oryzae Y34]
MSKLAELPRRLVDSIRPLLSWVRRVSDVPPVCANAPRKRCKEAISNALTRFQTLIHHLLVFTGTDLVYYLLGTLCSISVATAKILGPMDRMSKQGGGKLNETNAPDPNDMPVFMKSPGEMFAYLSESGFLFSETYSWNNTGFSS